MAPFEAGPRACGESAVAIPGAGRDTTRRRLRFRTAHGRLSFAAPDVEIVDVRDDCAIGKIDDA